MSLEELEKIISPIIEGEHIELVEIKTGGTERKRIIRVFIDKPGGVTVGDCEDISRQISTVLDVEWEENYVLEVSSPGLDRPLKNKNDFLRSIGRNVKVTLTGEDGGTRTIVGIVADAYDESFIIETGMNGEKEEINYNSMTNTILEIRF